MKTKHTARKDIQSTSVLLFQNGIKTVDRAEEEGERANLAMYMYAVVNNLCAPAMDLARAQLNLLAGQERTSSWTQTGRQFSISKYGIIQAKRTEISIQFRGIRISIQLDLLFYETSPEINIMKRKRNKGAMMI